MPPRWKRMPFRQHAHDLSIAVDDWSDILASGSTTGTPLKQAVFSNTWATPSASATNSNAQYYKDPFGRVHFKGAVKRGTSVPQLTTGEVILTMPVGYRPNHSVRFAAIDNVDADAVALPLKMTAGGDLSFVGDNSNAGFPSFYFVSGGTGYTSDLYLSLDGISYRAEEPKT